MKYAIICLTMAISLISKAQIVDIVDLDFKEFLIEEGYDLNNDGEIQVTEAEQVTEVSILLHENISTIEGIKAFVNLESLIIEEIGLKYIDVSDMVNLSLINVDDSKLENINAKNCTSLKDIKFKSDETIEVADFSGCTALINVANYVCADVLRFTNCTSLERLILFYCPFSELDLDGCSNFRVFYFADLITGINDDFSFDFSEFPKLDSFYLFNSLDFDWEITNAPNLEYLYLGDSPSLKIRECPKLKHVHISSFNDVDILKLPELEIFRCRNTNNVRIEECASLDSILILGNNDEIILNNCSSVEHLEFSGLSENDYWDFSGLSSLKTLISEKGPSTLILDGCVNLEIVDIKYPSAYMYDFSECTNLKEVDFLFPVLEYLILKNGTEEKLDIPYSKITNLCVDPDELAQTQYYFDSLGIGDIEISTSCDFASGENPFKLKGRSYFDNNNDSCKTSEIAIPYSKFKISSSSQGERFFFSDKSGRYRIKLIEDEYTYGPNISIYNDPFVPLLESRSVKFPDNGYVINQDFCFVLNNTDVDIIEVNLIPLEVARPGFDTKYLITYTNTGNVTRSGDIKLTFQDDFMDFESSEPFVDVQEEGYLSWSFEDLAPFESGNIEFTMNLNSPMDTPPLNDGDILNFKAEVGPLGNQTLTVYWSHLNQEVVNSFDPNDKTCLNGSVFDQELVGDYLKYMIRFENTGTAEAVNIVVTDTLDDTKFDVRTLQIINASHDVETELVDNVVKFIFKDIYLPFDDATNDGYVTFKIKTLPSLVLGDDIQNKAEIFFDFNFPIVTNTTSTVISYFTTIDDLEQNTFNLEISPNPASEAVLIRSDAIMDRVEIYDISGRVLNGFSFTEAKNSFNLPINQLKTGIYFIKVYSHNGKAIDKLIKE